MPSEFLVLATTPLKERVQEEAQSQLPFSACLYRKPSTHFQDLERKCVGFMIRITTGSWL